jgi:hypothetical protein
MAKESILHLLFNDAVEQIVELVLGKLYLGGVTSGEHDQHHVTEPRIPVLDAEAEFDCYDGV